MAEYLRIKPHQLGDAIYESVQETIEEDYEVLGRVVRAAGNAAKKSLASYHGTWIGFEQVGHDRRIYAKGWKVYNHRRNLKNGFVASTVANKNEPSVSHLVEYGHRLVRKGTVYGRVRPHPHMAEAEKAAMAVLDAAAVDRAPYIRE